ncbi:MAG TPA: dicarboxylate/amino acid:cation symporter [Flavobacteriales bacterium]|nr:dicarboxylate/amino acid:cation symporter [Flavobacteriales bacterium]HIA11548.1 dicarboxylate/amino acid:cation symporter [Flavobacteriales bacterium]
MKNIPLHWQVIIGLILGTIYAFCSVKFGWNQFTLDYIKPFGDIFINLLKLIAVPLVLFSVISGIASLKDITKLGRMGVKTLGIYLITTMFSVSLGLVLVNMIKPGEKIDDKLRVENRIDYELWRDSNPQVVDLDDICLSCDDENAALVENVRAKTGDTNAWVADKLNKAESQKKTGPLQPLVDVVPSNIFKALVNMSMLQVIFFAIFFGIVLVLIPKEKAVPVSGLIEGLNEVFVRMVWIIMKAMPVFVFALMAGQIVKAAGTDPDKFMEMLSFLGLYSVVVVVGLLLMIFLVYPLIVKFFTGIGYTRFLANIRDAQVTAFSTSSSIATLPVTMDCIENKIGVSKPVTSFVLPVGATVNMDGTSLYQAVAVVAMAQFHMIDLSIAQQLVIVITATLASIGAAAIPSAGLVLMIIVLESVGLNPAWIAIIFPVDRILDMCRTVVNVTGDATVATLIAKSEGELKNR